MTTEEHALLCMLALGETPLEVAQGLLRARGDRENPETVHGPIAQGLRGLLVCKSGVLTSFTSFQAADGRPGSYTWSYYQNDTPYLDVWDQMLRAFVRVHMPPACAEVHLAWEYGGKRPLEFIIRLLAMETHRERAGASRAVHAGDGHDAARGGQGPREGALRERDFNPSPILCGLRGALSGVMLRAAVTHGEDWHKGARRPHKGDIVTLEIYLPMQPPHPARPLTPQGPWKDPIRVRMPEACAAVHIAWLRTGKGSLELVIGLLEDKAYLQEQHEGKA